MYGESGTRSPRRCPRTWPPRAAGAEDELRRARRADVLLRRAADLGHPDAFILLASNYRAGRGVPRDEARAFEILHGGASKHPKVAKAFSHDVQVLREIAVEGTHPDYDAEGILSELVEKGLIDG